MKCGDWCRSHLIQCTQASETPSSCMFMELWKLRLGQRGGIVLNMCKFLELIHSCLLLIFSKSFQHFCHNTTQWNCPNIQRHQLYFLSCEDILSRVPLHLSPVSTGYLIGLYRSCSFTIIVGILFTYIGYPLSWDSTKLESHNLRSCRCLSQTHLTYKTYDNSLY